MNKNLRRFNLLKLQEIIENSISNCRQNRVNPEDVPVYITEQWHRYPINSVSHCVGDKGHFLKIDIWKDDEIVEVAPDSRPFVGGEYWKSRGVGDGLDLSGFIVSKLAGERLQRMVRFVLEKDDCKSHMDFREWEPTYIQFKFYPEEFDLNKLHSLSMKSTGVLTVDILSECAVTLNE